MNNTQNRPSLAEQQLQAFVDRLAPSIERHLEETRRRRVEAGLTKYVQYKGSGDQ